MIEQIDACIKWLDNNKRSTNIVEISQTIDRLAVLSVTLGTMVSDAYALMNKLEDDYDIAFASKFTELTKSGISAAAAKPQVEAELAEPKRDWTSAKNGYKKLSVYLDRIDKVIESYRQYISVTKLDLKNG